MTPTDKQAAIEAALDRLEEALTASDGSFDYREARAARAALLALLAEPRSEGVADGWAPELREIVDEAKKGEAWKSEMQRLAAAPSPTPVEPVSSIDHWQRRGHHVCQDCNGTKVRSYRQADHLGGNYVDVPCSTCQPTPALRGKFTGFRCEGIDPMQTYVDDPTLPTPTPTGDEAAVARVSDGYAGSGRAIRWLIPGREQVPGMLLYKRPNESAEPRGLPDPMPEELFDSYSVLNELTVYEQRRTSAENVTDVLNATVRLIRRRLDAITHADEGKKG